MEAYTKTTPISRGKSKARVESSHLIDEPEALWACRDVDLLSSLEFWGFQTIDLNDIGNK